VCVFVGVCVGVCGGCGSVCECVCVCVEVPLQHVQQHSFCDMEPRHRWTGTTTQTDWNKAGSPLAIPIKMSPMHCSGPQLLSRLCNRARNPLLNARILGGESKLTCDYHVAVMSLSCDCCVRVEGQLTPPHWQRYCLSRPAAQSSVDS